MKESIKWWFTRGVVSAITIPIFLLLLVMTVSAFYNGGIQTLAYVRVTKAVWGWLGVIACLFIWPFSLLMPGWLIWSAIKETPKIISQREEKTKGSAVALFVFGLIFLVGLASLMQWGHGHVIGWIADHDPDAAYKAGVTGSKPPSGYKP
ncbi:MAG: hypothetical protein HYX71_01415 [Opitutae bacterium]|nr:hypothetical protein [Opitutae bacterium]